MSVAKLPLRLIAPQFIAAIAGVLAWGARKYAPFNWMKGMSWSTNLESVERHLASFKMGEFDDKETGLAHLAHAACGIFFAWWFAHGPTKELYAKFNDLPFQGGSPGDYMPSVGLPPASLLEAEQAKWSGVL